MVDIHCHILPGVDDGAQTSEDAINMANAALKQGISTIIATPHHLNSHEVNPKQAIQEQLESLNRLFQQEKIDIKIVPGQEVRIHGELLKGIETGDIQPLGDSNYILVEFPSSNVPHYTEKLFFDLQLKGYTPIIAHPERNQELIQRPEILYRLVKNGALSQITAASAVGKFGKKIKKFTMELLSSNLTHFLASDAHNTTNRGFMLVEAYSTIQSQLGTDMVYLLKENAELLLEGKHAICDIPSRIKQKKFLGLF
ncbi:tyrosine protein phosphatase [Bacillus sp. FJAT-27225]|uniref:tyrosine-protein phosphatase n=1 Tax=Bacillus sp. FJAT-27225 TaxID=1743144 RepID=UPI00080C34AF|nr:CpsB/CapC family capsule biosynthesis tyrosine phosphatase [Bacillus sp. FJAT-27225]OCA87896.1 tyrosine protein phosphatase [Bacillus sp. FJAT-27225]